MYAAEHELGYDPTIQIAKDQSRYKNQFDITIHHVERGAVGTDTNSIDTSKLKTVVFRTETLVSDIGAEAMRSRGTRVWTARKLGRHGEVQGPLMIIKDYWVDHYMSREADTYARILDDAQTEADRDILKRHLLTPVYFGDVVIDGQRDNTLSLLRRGAAVPSDTAYPTIHGDDSYIQPMLFHEKSHHRIVFLEYCVPISRLNSGREVLSIVMQVTDGEHQSSYTKSPCN